MKEGKLTGYGPINFTEDRSRFFITVQPIQRTAFDISFCKKSSEALMAALESGQPFQDFDKNIPETAQRRAWFGWSCLTKDQLLLKSNDKKPQEFRSYDLQSEFYGVVPPEMFFFYANASFKQVEEFDSGTVAISLGQCEKIVPPK